MSGRTIAKTSPGNPAPLPMSKTREFSGISSSTTAQFAMCRSQIRSTSRGPRNPRSTPAPANQAANRVRFSAAAGYASIMGFKDLIFR